MQFCNRLGIKQAFKLPQFLGIVLAAPQKVHEFQAVGAAPGPACTANEKSGVKNYIIIT